MQEPLYTEKLRNMIFKRFTLLIIIQVLLLGLIIYLFFWALTIQHLKFTVYGLIIFSVIQMIVLIAYCRRFYLQINKFLESFIINEPYPKIKSKYFEKTFLDIEKNLEKIASTYNEVKADREAEHNFLQALIEKINVGILVINDDGKVSLCNKIGKSLLGIEDLRDIKQICDKNQNIYRRIIHIISEKPEIFKLFNNYEIKQVSVSVSKFVIREEHFKLIVLKDISPELEHEEVENWQKLISILRHEIINSITPITTLSSTLVSDFRDYEITNKVDPELHKPVLNAYKGLMAIEKRGIGLMQFVKNYKDLTSTIKPELSRISSIYFIEQIITLVSSDITAGDIIINTDIAEDFKLLIDEKQIIQVLINLVKNAVEAMEGIDSKRITISCYKNESNTFISVKDNGHGIPKDELNNIFIPFYTTKKNGSGIGLSICRQIMQLHKGSINVSSRPGETVFKLVF